jgi:hypothetical protein
LISPGHSASSSGAGLGAAQGEAGVLADPADIDRAGVKPRCWSACLKSAGAVCRVKANRYLTQPPVNRKWRMVASDWLHVSTVNRPSTLLNGPLEESQNEQRASIALLSRICPQISERC